MPLKNSEGDWINRNGNPVPEKNIPKHLKKRDAIVTKMVKEAEKVQLQMIKAKGKIKKYAEAYSEWLTKKKCKDVTPEGNMQLSNYSNTMQVSFYTNDIIGFDDNLNYAKALINKCMKKWSKGASNNIKIIVNNAFKVDKKGNLNRALILSLLQIEIKDKDWNKAMELIKQSIITTETRQYIKISKRSNHRDKYRAVVLDMSSL